MEDFAEFGHIGLFIAAFLAATILPLSGAAQMPKLSEAIEPCCTSFFSSGIAIFKRLQAVPRDQATGFNQFAYHPELIRLPVNNDTDVHKTSG